MKRYISLVLVVGLLLNVVIPVCATSSEIDETEVEGFWRDVIKTVDVSCAVVGVVAAYTGGGICATGVGTVTCSICVGWAAARAASALA